MQSDQPRALLDHLDELRQRLILALVGVGLGMLLVLPWVSRIITWMARPVGRLVFLSPTEAFMAQFKIAMVTGFLLTLPWVLYQLWRFVAIALTPPERRHARWILPSTYGLFLVGVAFSWFVVVPLAVQFLVRTGTPSLRPLWSIEAYLNFSLGLSCTIGVLFELPLVLLFLARLGIVSKDTFAGKRRVVYVLIVIAAGLLTPGPDVLSQVLVAIPMVLLFELSLWLLQWAGKAGSHA